MSTWDRFKIKTSPKIDRGTIYMHPDDAAEMRPTTVDALVARLAPGTKLAAPPRHVARYKGHAHGSDDAARERIRRQVADELARRAAEGSDP